MTAALLRLLGVNAALLLADADFQDPHAAGCLLGLIGQGQQLFTALQTMKVPSKLIQFPDEGHWILKPQNSQFWYSSVLDWLRHYTQAPASAEKSSPQ